MCPEKTQEVTTEALLKPLNNLANGCICDENIKLKIIYQCNLRNNCHYKKGSSTLFSAKPTQCINPGENGWALEVRGQMGRYERYVACLVHYKAMQECQLLSQVSCGFLRHFPKSRT